MKTAFLTALTLVTTTAASASVLYSQTWDGTGNSFSSQNDTGGGFGNYATVYDNFTLAAGGHITSVAWTGEYFNPPSQGTITGWTVSIYSDNAGQPGALLYQDIVGGTGNETSDGTAGGFPVFSYDVSADFVASGGTQYWLAVVPDLAFPPQWGWNSGTGGDSVAYQDFFGARSELGNDMAFTLSGTGVPEPAAWALMIVGFAGLGAAMRGRRGRLSAA